MDRLLFHRAHPPERGTEQEDDPLSGIEFVELGWDLAEAMHLYSAYEKGILPRAGGYLDQPRAFRQLIELFNMRYGRMLALSPDDVDDMRLRYREELDPQKLIADTPAVTSFDAFRRG